MKCAMREGIVSSMQSLCGSDADYFVVGTKKKRE